MSSRIVQQMQPVLSLDPADHDAAAAIALKQQRQRNSRSRSSRMEGEISDGSAFDEELDFGPEQECKYSDEELLKTKTPLLYGSDVEAKREEIREYFHKTFSLYERLFDLLSSDATYMMQPEKLRHPLIFYFGHTAVFFINKLRLAGLLQGRINEALESTLAIGVDEMSWDDLNSANYVWPSVAQVRAYRDVARVVVDDLISTMPLQLPITWESPFWVILMGCEHERIHLETSSVLFRQLPAEEVRALPMWSHCKQFREDRSAVPPNELLPVPGGAVLCDKTQQNQRVYGWDLEYGHHAATVAPFHAARFLVSNAEFYEFVAAGGYERPELWGEEGWKFVQFRRAQHPVFWVPAEAEGEGADGETDGGDVVSPAKTLDGVAAAAAGPRFRYRALTAVIPMPWDWPADVNFIEAKAFCNWRNELRAREHQRAVEAAVAAGAPVPEADPRVFRMPTEDEYLRLRDHAFPATAVDPASGATVSTDQPFWQRAPGNINLEREASSCPVDACAFAEGFFDIVGNAWQWSETPLQPRRGFAFHPLYDDFSVPTFDTRHNVFCGGSWASTGNEATRDARFAFRRHFYQHAGFRYVLAAPLATGSAADGGAAATNAAMCETDPAVAAMLDAQYNDAAQARLARSMCMQPRPNYAVQLARLAFDAFKTYANVAAGPTPSPSATPAADGEEQISSPSASPSPSSSSSIRALDIGCACGRSTFELAKLAAGDSGDGVDGCPALSTILGLDFSTRFIRVAAQLQFDQHAEYAMCKEGSLQTYHSIESVAHATSPLDAGSDAHAGDSASSAASASASAVSLSSASISSSTPSVLDLDLRRLGMQDRVEFQQGDACNLASKHTDFSLVLAANLIEYLYAPRAFLESIGARVRSGGVLLLASTYEWDEAHTPRDAWLGGMKDRGGESVDSARAVAEILSAAFEPLPHCSVDLPMIWRNNQRNFSLRISHVTAWRKK